LANLSVKVLSGVIITKFIAVLIGAEGMALIGNLRNFYTAIQSLSIGGMYRGSVKYISRYKEDLQKLSETISTVYYVGFILTFSSALLCYYNAEAISRFLFNGSYRYIYVIEMMGLLIPFYALNMFTFSIMNGFAKYKILLIINIIGQILGLLVTLVLIWQDNIDGALISIVITPALLFLITLVGILGRRSLIGLIQFKRVTLSALEQLSPYTIVAILTSISIPFVLILIRNHIITTYGLQQAGFWQAMNRISDYYLMLVNSLLVLYVFPRLNALREKAQFKAEVFKFYKKVMPYFAGVLVLMYLLRKPIVELLLSQEFEPTQNLFSFQLLGDFVKVMAMVIALQFLAKRMFMHFIILQIFLFAMLYFSSIYLIDLYGIRGAVMAHCVSYSLYFVIILLLFQSSLFGVLPDQSE
jgi:PST family polysaccharide transporter